MKRSKRLDELLDAIADESERIFGFENYPSKEESAWLVGTYNISKEEHLRYELILDYVSDDLAEEETDYEALAFVRDDAAVLRFLGGY